MSSIGSFSDIVAGRAKILISADDVALAKSLNRISANFRGFGEKLRGIGLRIGGAGASVFTPIAAAAEAYAAHGSELAAGSKKTGESVEQLSLQEYAAQQTEVSFDDLTMAIARMNKNLGTTVPSKQFTAALGQMKTSTADILKLPVDQRFEAIASALARMPDPARQAAAGNGVFSRSFVTLLPLINSNISALEAHGKALGLQWSTEDADRAEVLQRTLRDLWDGFKRISEVVGAAVAPAFTKVAGVINLAMRPIMDLIRAHSETVTALAAISATIVLIGSGLVIAGAALGAIATLFTTVAGIVSLVLSPVSLLVVGIGLVGAGLTTAFAPQVLRAFAEEARAVGKVFEDLGQIVDLATDNASTLGKAFSIAMGEAALDAKKKWAEIIDFIAEKAAPLLSFINGGTFSYNYAQTDVEKEKRDYESGVEKEFSQSGEESLGQQLRDIEAQLSGRLDDLGGASGGGLGQGYETFSTFGSAQLGGGGGIAENIRNIAEHTKQTAQNTSHQALPVNSKAGALGGLSAASSNFAGDWFNQQIFKASQALVHLFDEPTSKARSKDPENGVYMLQTLKEIRDLLKTLPFGGAFS